MLSDYATAVEDLVRDKDQVLSDTQRDAAIAAAVLRYSQDRPRQVLADLVSAGGYRLTPPGDWVVGFSAVVQVEHPVDQVPAVLLDPLGGVSVYRSATTVELIELRQPLDVGAAVRLTYTTRHAVTALTDTIPLDDRDAVCCWAAARICDQFAAHYASAGEPTIQADTVQHATKSQTWAARARVYRQQYFGALGIVEAAKPSGSAVANWDSTDSRGQPRLFTRHR